MSKSYPFLSPGDEIRVIAPSNSWTKKLQPYFARAQKRLEKLGYKITFGENIKQISHQETATAEVRVADFNAAYADQNVRAVWALMGGHSSNDILPLIDWNAVRANPKPMIGFSDTTILTNAIYAKVQNVNYMAPTFHRLGALPEWQYTLSNFQRIVSGEKYVLNRSQKWSEFTGRELKNTKPWKVVKEGLAQAILLGGNLGTFYLLQGTEYCPKFDRPFIFAMEDDHQDSHYTGKEVARRLESLLQLPNFRANLRGLLVGRFQKTSFLSDAELERILLSKNLGEIPIVTRIDFGHTYPMLTLPIGGQIKLSAKNHRVHIEVNV